MKKIIGSAATLLCAASLTLASSAFASDAFRWTSEEGVLKAPARSLSSMNDPTPSHNQFSASSPAKLNGILARNSDEGNFESGAVLNYSDDQSMTNQALLTLSGTISSDNLFRWHSEERSPTDSVTFRNNNGQTFDLAENVNSIGLSNLDGRTVEIKGTVMERAGEKIIEVSDYSIVD